MAIVATIAGARVALPASQIASILPIAPLLRPPTLPPIVAGLLRLATDVLPVIDGARLIGRPDAAAPTLHAHILVVPALAAGLLVARAERAVAIPAAGRVPVNPRDSLNGCAVAICEVEGEAVHLLAVDRLLAAGDAARIAGLAEDAARRLALWEDAA